jgi:hypothetical protein
VLCAAVVVAAAVLAGYVFGSSRSEDNTGEAVAAVALLEEPATAPPATIPIEIIEPPVPAGSIAVPGFERLTVRGQTLFADNISNPARNDCYFIVVISLADGTEIFRSGILAPGQSVGTAELAHTLTPGIYENVIARYSAYARENLQPLNGADVKFLMEVLP